jgi:Sporulation and spore germination
MPRCPEPVMKPLPKKSRPLLLALLALVLLAGGLLLRSVLTPAPPPSPAPSPVAETPPQSREVILYFGAVDGTHLVAESRELNDCGDDQACLRSILHALIAGPIGEGAPIIPPHTELRGISEDDQGLATVDFSAELVNGHPGGSMSELLSVYAVVDSLAVNFPYLRQVRFLVEGKPVETLKGHVDLRQPLAPDFSLTRSATEEATPQTSEPARKEQ